MAQAALKQDSYYDNPTEEEIAAIDTSKIPRICGALAPRNKAEFLALMAESERAFAEGKGIPIEQAFNELNARLHFRN